jgi:hypothetical protein
MFLIVPATPPPLRCCAVLDGAFCRELAALDRELLFLEAELPLVLRLRVDALPLRPFDELRDDLLLELDRFVVSAISRSPPVAYLTCGIPTMWSQHTGKGDVLWRAGRR